MDEAPSFRKLGFWRRLSGLTPAQVFASVAGVVGVLVVVVTPPFQVPDEPNHFARAFQISEGQVVSQRIAGSVGGWLPRSIDEAADTVMGRVPFNPDVKQDLDAWARAFDIPLLPQDRIETIFPNTALSGPVAYLPQALGIELGRPLGVSALALFYWGRFSSLFWCVAITALAIRWLTVRPWTCVLLALLPMTLYVRSSLSSDGPTLALTVLAMAICLRPIALEPRDGHLARSRNESADRRQWWLLFGVAALMALGKPPYGAVVFLALATPPRLVGGMKRYIAMTLALTTVFVVAQGGWALAMRGLTAVMAPGSDPEAQWAYLVDNPGDAVAVLAQDLIRSAPALAHQAVGVLGWLDAPLPGLVAVILGVLIVLVALGEPGPPSACAAFGWLGAAICGVGTLTLLAMNYLWWTPPRAVHVEGIQGRHLLPLIPFLFLSLNPPIRIARPLARVRPLLVIMFIVVSATTTLFTVFDRYYG